MMEAGALKRAGLGAESALGVAGVQRTGAFERAGITRAGAFERAGMAKRSAFDIAEMQAGLEGKKLEQKRREARMKLVDMPAFSMERGEYTIPGIADIEEGTMRYLKSGEKKRGWGAYDY